MGWGAVRSDGREGALIANVQSLCPSRMTHSADHEVLRTMLNHLLLGCEMSERCPVEGSRWPGAVAGRETDVD
jgi:hypothetical protein